MRQITTFSLAVPDSWMVLALRKGEAAALTWDAFDREAWTITLHAKDAKTKKGRTLALEGPLREVLERRVGARRLNCPFIFHRDGVQVREFRRAWTSAAKRAGLPGALFHDLWRSAIRNVVRAGVDPAVAMRIYGHRTDRTLRRCNILDDADLRAAIAKTSEYVPALPRERKAAPLAKKTKAKREHGQKDKLHRNAAKRRRPLSGPSTGSL